MNEDVLNMLKSGKIPYRYTYDTESALYFAAAVLVIMFLYALVRTAVRKFIG